MARGEFKIAKQFGPKGYFGKVVLRTEPLDTGKVDVEFDEEHAARWQTGARFGIDWILEHVSKRTLFPNGLRVHVDSIEGHEVDTTTSLIAYVTALALLQALGAEPKTRPSLDEAEGLVVFPK